MKQAHWVYAILFIGSFFCSPLLSNDDNEASENEIRAIHYHYYPHYNPNGHPVLTPVKLCTGIMLLGAGCTGMVLETSPDNTSRSYRLISAGLIFLLTGIIDLIP